MCLIVFVSQPCVCTPFQHTPFLFVICLQPFFMKSVTKKKHFSISGIYQQIFSRNFYILGDVSSHIWSLMRWLTTISPGSEGLSRKEWSGVEGSETKFDFIKLCETNFILKFKATSAYALACSVHDWEDKLWNCAVLDGVVGKLIFQLRKCSRDDRTWHCRQLNAVPGLVKNLYRKIWKEWSKKWFLESLLYRGLRDMVTHGDWVHSRWLLQDIHGET